MVDIQRITEDVEGILTHSQDYPFDLNAANLINQWYQAKKPFIDMFEGATILRSKLPVKIYLSEKQRCRRFNDFLTTLDDNGILTPEFENFLRENEQGFFDNRVIHSGAKLSKSFKRFLTNTETIRWAQDTASRYIQENKIEGYLYLSVDPRDFLTLSENNERWWSCQTLDGDYRAGNLSYMVDTTTIIAYLADEKQERLKCLPLGMKWNSKKWRMLIHTDDKNCIYYNKQYPYESEELLNEVHNFICKHLKHKYFTIPLDIGFKVIQTQWEQTILPYNQMNCGGRSFDARDIVDTSDYRGYCDLISSSSYTPVVAVDEEGLIYYRDTLVLNNNREDEEIGFHRLFDIKVGEKAICPCCGQEHIGRDDSFLCSICIAEQDADEDFYLRCKSCYHHIYDEDEVFWVKDVPYCKECYKEMLKEDENVYDEEEI